MNAPANTAAFEATRYRLRLMGETVELRIGHADTDAERHLWRQLPAERHWVLITTDNPGARLQPAEDQQRARRELHNTLAQGGWHWVPTRHQDPQHEWPTEYGCCVADLPLNEADRLMQVYGQLAVVVWSRGEAPALRWAQATGG